MDMVFRWLRKHQIAGYFLLIFAISWGSWILGIVLFSEDELLQAPFFKIGVFAPAGVAILVSSQINRKPSGEQALLKRGIFGAALLAAWFHIVLYAHVTSNLIVNAKLIVVGGLIAALPAFVISNAFSSNNGVQKLLDSIIKPRGNPLWYLFAVLLIPITMALGCVIDLAMGKNLPSLEQSIYSTAGLGIIILVFLNELIQAGGLPEEVGWRGFALPRLQARFSPLTASIILGSIWTLWHGPLLIGMLQEAGPWRMLVRILMISVSFTWLYNRTGGSLLVVMLLHASWNTALTFLPRTDVFLLLMMALLTAGVITDRMWENLSADSVTRYREADEGLPNHSLEQTRDSAGFA